MNREWVVRAAASAVVAAVGLVWAQAPAGGQPPKADRPAKGKDARYYSDREVQNSCGLCHKSRPPGSTLADGDSLVLLNEFTVWQHHDLHRRACDALSSKLGEQMSQLLYGDPKAAGKKAECLVCHATDAAPGAPLSADIPDRFRCDLGVNCQACHGPAAKWEGPHRLGEWRPLSGHEKMTTYGLTDLRNPAVRAQVCAGCHVGNASESKFVTHDMYAAGHPPLPAFELATFSRDEPRHWLSAADVPFIRKIGDPKAARDRYNYRKGEVEAARLAAVGAVVCFRESVALLQAPPQQGGLDFSHFNCAACHHELRIPSDRQLNGFPGVPGRPIPQTWPVWLTRVVIEHAAGVKPDSKVKPLQKDFEDQYRALRDAFDARPFGDPAKIAEVSTALVKTCNALLTELDQIDYTQPVAEGLLAELAKTAAAPPDGKRRDFIDPDAAGQLARASAAIYAELAGGYADPFPPPDGPPTRPPAIDRLKADPKGLAKLLAELNAVVPLAVRDDYHNGLGPDGKPVPDHERFLIQHPANLGRRLEMQSKFKSDTFRDVLTRIAQQLGRPPG